MDLHGLQRVHLCSFLHMISLLSLVFLTVVLSSFRAVGEIVSDCVSWCDGKICCLGGHRVIATVSVTWSKSLLLFEPQFFHW